MISRILTIAFISATLIGNTGCNSGGSFQKYKGIEYKIVKDAKGKNAQVGDIVEFHITAKADTTTLADSRKQQNNKPAVIKVEETKMSGMFQSVFTKLSVGDSAVVEISCDTMLKVNPPQPNQPLPPWLKAGKKVVVTVAVTGIKTMEQYNKDMQAEQEKMQKEMEEKAAAQAPIDDKLLEEYIAKNNIKATKTASGMYYSITKPGSGPNAKAGENVTMSYIGKTLEGKQFDANVDESFKPLDGKQPFTFPLGQQRVIKGWDEGVALLNKGSRAVFYIPSRLAYGPQDQGPDLPANSILVFNVEVKDIKAAPKADAQTPPAPQQ